MSAWIVEKAHIDVIVKALIARNIGGSDPHPLGQQLYDENFRSVRARYGNEDPETAPAYTYTNPPVNWTPTELLKIVGCFEYQTSQVDDWSGGNEVFDLCEELCRVLVNEGAMENSPEYNAAPWGVATCGHRHSQHETCPDQADIPKPIDDPEAVAAWLDTKEA